jgi:hypothetical protein
MNPIDRTTTAAGYETRIDQDNRRSPPFNRNRRTHWPSGAPAWTEKPVGGTTAGVGTVTRMNWQEVNAQYARIRPAKKRAAAEGGSVMFRQMV